MEKVTNYGYSKRAGKPPKMYKIIINNSANRIDGFDMVRTKTGKIVRLGNNMEVSLLNEYSFYYAATHGENGSPIFIVNDGSLYLSCYWGDIMEHKELFADLSKKVYRKELTAFDLLGFLVL